jgi:HEAT repeat protein
MKNARAFSAVAVLLLTGIGLVLRTAHSADRVLFEQLQSNDATDTAAQRLLKLGSSSSRTRSYFVSHLPALIAAGPKNSFAQWQNEVDLAGALRISAASQALADWITLNSDPIIDLGREERLTSYPAAHALVQIGDPAVPAIQHVLETGDANHRWKAAYALNLIGSPSARAALKARVPRESDPALTHFLQEAGAG